ncbi:MAG: hypothetical protein EZS28_017007 [Streblomastix strix]|uniref:Uncharacterized protein n=1 Tax=Streblomastix strix TaxID=222440 RepID=A0A5J4VYI6_9EUKA|nr:MAG: hypothetical protein EZS28_017007 [Streblomastix strix]
MEEDQPISDLEDPSEEELQQMKSEYVMMMKQQQEIESLQKFQFFKQTQVDLSHLVTLNTAQTITGSKSFTQPITANKIIKFGGTSNQILLANGDTTDVGDFLPKYYPHAMGQMIIEPNDDIRNQGLRLMKNKANWDSFVLTGCNTDPQDRDGVWKMGSTSSQFRIQKQEDEAYDYNGLIIDFDCTSLKFNNQLVAPLPTPPIEYATQQTLGISVFDFFTWGKAALLNKRVYISIAITHSDPNTYWNTGYTIFSVMNDDAKPKFSESSYNNPLNAIMYVTKQSCNPVPWTNAVVIDCIIDPDVVQKYSLRDQARTTLRICLKIQQLQIQYVSPHL